MEIVKDLLGGWSKKLTGLLVFVAVVLLNRKFELGISESEVWALAVGTGAYTIGQGVADFGKGKEQAVEKHAASKPNFPNEPPAVK